MANRRSSKLKELLVSHHAWEAADSSYSYRWKLRLLQSLWRQESDFPAQTWYGKLRGARLDISKVKGEDKFKNFLSKTAVEYAKQRYESLNDPTNKDRKAVNLLTSETLCFNLFAELKNNLELASKVLRKMTDNRVHEVIDICFEYSPRSRSFKVTEDKTAFDVYVSFTHKEGKRGFLGIEVKYHENLKGSKRSLPDEKKNERYDEITEEMKCFHTEKPEFKDVKEKPSLNQMWRNHLLVGSYKTECKFDDGVFVFLYPKINEACEEAVEEYRNLLENDDSFMPWTIDCFVETLRKETKNADWVELIHSRYLDYSPVCREIEKLYKR